MAGQWSWSAGIARRIVAGALVGAAALTSAGTLAAQGRHPGRRGIVEVERDRSGRHGLWLQLGVGAAGERYSVEPTLDDYSSSLTRPVISLAVGGTPSRHFRLGGELSSWIDTEEGTTQTLTSILAVAQYYPMARSGFYLKAGGGLAHDNVSYVDDFDNSDLGFAASLGAGWELPIGRRFYVAPRVDLTQQWYSRRSAPDYRERLVHLGVSLGFQPGH